MTFKVQSLFNKTPTILGLLCLLLHHRITSLAFIESVRRPRSRGQQAEVPAAAMFASADVPQLFPPTLHNAGVAAWAPPLFLKALAFTTSSAAT